MIVIYRTQFQSPYYLDSFVPQLKGWYINPLLDFFPRGYYCTTGGKNLRKTGRRTSRQVRPPQTGQ
jgi:hypothetical protein